MGKCTNRSLFREVINMKHNKIIIILLTALLVLAGTAGLAGALTFGGGEQHDFTEDFFIEECTFTSRGSNTYFVLEPGHQLVLEGFEGKEEVHLVITVLNETENVMGVKTRVVEEFETVDGELAEISRNYFALCKETGNLFYFGEDVDDYEDGVVVSHEGAWRAGEDGALPGVLVPGSPMLGARYFQEIAPDVAMDRAEVISLDAVVETPYGVFERCLETEETTPIEPNAKELKFYAPGVGLIVDGTLFLTDVVSH
jgi:hypothetical protein